MGKALSWAVRMIRYSILGVSLSVLAGSASGLQSAPNSGGTNLGVKIDSERVVHVLVTAWRANGDIVSGLRATDFRVQIGRVPATVISAQPFSVISTKSNSASIEPVNVLLLLQPEIEPNSWIGSVVKGIRKDIEAGITAHWRVSIVDPNAHVWPATTDQVALDRELQQIQEEKVDHLLANAWSASSLTAWRALSKNPGRLAVVYRPDHTQLPHEGWAWEFCVESQFAECHILEAAPPHFSPMPPKGDTLRTNGVQPPYLPLSYRNSFHDAFEKINENGPGTYDLALQSQIQCGIKSSCMAQVTFPYEGTILKAQNAMIPVAKAPRPISEDKPYHPLYPVLYSTTTDALSNPDRPLALAIGTWLFPNWGKQLRGGFTEVITVKSQRGPADTVKVDLLSLDGDGNKYLVERRVSGPGKSETSSALSFFSEYSDDYGNYEVVAKSLTTGETAVTHFEIYPRQWIDELRVSSPMLSTGCSTDPLPVALAAHVHHAPPHRDAADLFSPLNEGSCKWVPLYPKSISPGSTLYARLLFYLTEKSNDVGFPSGWTATCTIRKPNGDVVSKKSPRITTGKYRGWEIVQNFSPEKDRLLPGGYKLEFKLDGPGGQTIKSDDTFAVEENNPESESAQER